MNNALTNRGEPSFTAQLPQIAPLDEHNRYLLAQVHPTDWTNPRPTGRYNLVVIGGGTAGLVTAAGAAGLGAKVALVERHLLGGDCLNVGCVPSKALIRAARAWADVRDAAQYGIRVPEGVAVDFPAVMERMRKLRSEISPHDSAARFRELGVDVFLGNARFTSRDSIEVSGSTLQFGRACIATGGRAAAPPIPGLLDAGYLTNETVFNLTKLPGRLAVIGAGPIGCELAQTFARFGSQVWLIETEHGVLPRDDPDAAKIVRGSLERDGVQLLCCGKKSEVRSNGSEKVLRVESHGTQYEVTVDEILVGAGRTPNVEGLELQRVGAAFDQSGVRVNDFLQTTNANVYAAGDVCSRFKFTHAADAMARIVIQNALFFGRKRVSALTIPWCTFTDPEVAHVGLLPQHAEKENLAIDTIAINLGDVDRAVLDGERDGFLKVHTLRGSDTIAGATLVSRHAGESISEIVLAMSAGVGLKAIASVIHPYPTQAEIIKRAADACNRSRLSPRIKSWFEMLLRWRR